RNPEPAATATVRLPSFEIEEPNPPVLTTSVLPAQFSALVLPTARLETVAVWFKVTVEPLSITTSTEPFGTPVGLQLFGLPQTPLPSIQVDVIVPARTAVQGKSTQAASASRAASVQPI